MTINELTRILPPPESPVGVPTADSWGRALSNGCAIPDDLKVFLITYGIGAVDDWLWIMGVTTQSKYLDIVAQTERQKCLIHQALDLGYLEDGQSRWLHRGAFIIFAVSDDGDVCIYGDDLVVVLAPRMQSAEFFPGTISDFILSVLLRRIKVASFPSDFPNVVPCYRPAVME